MSEQALTSPEKEPRHDEYAELRRRIGDGGWNPGDIFCTSQGVTWQFRETPYTSDFPDVHEWRASEQTSADHGLPGFANNAGCSSGLLRG